MVYKDENNRLIIEIGVCSEMDAAAYITELHNSLCELVSCYDTNYNRGSGIKTTTEFLKELIPSEKGLQALFHLQNSINKPNTQTV